MQTLSKFNTVFFILIIFICGSIFFASSISAFFAANFIFLFIIFFVYLSNRNYIIPLYIIFLPIGEIISSTYNLLGIIGIDEIISIFTILHLNSNIYSLKSSNFAQIFVKRLITISIIFIVYVTTKDVVTGNDSTNGITYGLYTLLKFLIRYYPLYIIINNLNKPNMNFLTRLGIIYGIIILCLSSIFTIFLDSINVTVDVSEGGIEGLKSSFLRAMGFFTGGDVNSFAGFLVISFGYFLTRFEKKEYSLFNLLICVLIIYTLFITASRTAFISLFIILAIFLIRNFSVKSLSRFFIIGLISLLFVNPLIDRVTKRFESSSTYAQFDYDSTGRLGKAIIYLDYIQRNPEVLIAGYVKPISYNRSPHNYYINLIYQTGLFLFILVIYLYVKFLRSIIRNHFSMIYLFLPYLLTILTVDSVGSAIYMYLLPLVYNLKSRNKKSNL